MRRSLSFILYLICALTDFAAFVVVFVASRSLAEQHYGTAYLGAIGAALAVSQGLGSILGGWLADRFSSRWTFLTGAAAILASICACYAAGPGSLWFVPGYLFLGIGLGLLYPPLIGWLNQGKDAIANHSGVSRTLFLFCVSWNLGMMAGQLTAGPLFEIDPAYAFRAAIGGAAANVLLASVAVSMYVPLPVVAAAAPLVPDATAVRAAAFKRLSWLANLGGTFGGSMVMHLLPDLVVTIDVPADSHGRLLAVWRGVAILVYLLLHASAFWHYRFGISAASQGLAVVGLVVISQATSSTMLLAGLVLLGQLIGYNYFSGLFYSTAGSAHARRSTAAGLHEATLAAGMAVGTFAGGLLGSMVNQRVPYLFAAAVTLVLLGAQTVAWWRWIRPLDNRDVSEEPPLAPAVAMRGSGEAR